MVDLEKVEEAVRGIEGPMKQVDATLPGGRQIQVDLTPDLLIEAMKLNADEADVVKHTVKMRRCIDQQQQSKGKVRLAKLKILETRH